MMLRTVAVALVAPVITAIAWFHAFSGYTDWVTPMHVAIAAALGVTDPNRLAEIIGDQDMVVVLDNCEHVISAAAQMAAALLDRYESRRRPLNIQYVQQQTIANKKRLEERDPEARAARFAELRATAADPAKHKQFLMRTSLLESVRQAR